MKPVDKIIIMITATVCLILILAAINPLITGKSLSDSKAEIMAGIVISLVAIISMYIGRRGGK